MPDTIQVRLKRLRMTQRELLQELRKIGFSQLSEYRLSAILTGYYPPTEGAEAIVNAADGILRRCENSAQSQVKQGATNGAAQV